MCILEYDSIADEDLDCIDSYYFDIDWKSPCSLGRKYGFFFYYSFNLRDHDSLVSLLNIYSYVILHDITTTYVTLCDRLDQYDLIKPEIHENPEMCQRKFAWHMANKNQQIDRDPIVCES